MKKLNLGCGIHVDHYFDGWVNIDTRQGVADLVCQIDALPEEFIDACDVIYASHVLEHFTMNEILAVLTKWFSYLKKGGELRIVVPDARIVAQNIIDGFDSKGRRSLSVIETTPILTQVYGLGYRSSDQEHVMKHWMLFDANSLKQALNHVGYHSVNTYSREEDPSYALGLNNDAMGPFSLFVKAKK